MKLRRMRFHRTATLAAATAALTLAISTAHAERIDVGLFGGLHVFSHDNELGVFDVQDAFSLENAADIGVRAAYAINELLYVEGELDFHPTEIRETKDNVLAVGWRAHALFDLGTTAQRPFLLVGLGGLSALSDNTDALENDTDFVLHAGTGLKFDFGSGWAARADFRFLFPPSSEGNSVTTDLELLVGVTKSFGARPAPAPPADTDGDGVADGQDQCPNEAEDLDGNEDANGCPEEELPKDSDGDGMTDDTDQCPSEAEDVDQFEDENGCPDADNDADGIADAADQCRGEAEDVDGFEDDDGCPDADNDGDGMADTSDQCPDQAEARNGFADGDGCADEIPEDVTQNTGVLDGIRFAGTSDRLLPASNAGLDAAVAMLQKYPDLRVEISGHTDDAGDRDANVDLSRRRAEAVKAYLVSKGVEESRLVTVGHGPDKPVVENTTPANRAKNRRIELRLLLASE